MAIRINNIKIALEQDLQALKPLCAQKLRLKERDIKGFKIVKESVDARHKDRISLIYSVELTLDGDERAVAGRFNNSDIVFVEPESPKTYEFGTQKLDCRPIIVGSGPAGLFAGLLLSKYGYSPLIIERGKRVDERVDSIYRFWNRGDFDPESNVQFGEGGAGTFSDGKLTTRIRDVRCSMVLDELVKFGAPEEIKYNYKPHIGTDILKTVVANMRNEIIKKGGEVMFSSKLTGIEIAGGSVTGITVNDSLKMDCSALVLAIGHSARDTVEMLHRIGVKLTPKPFAVGFRIEHRQDMIDEAQYGKYARHEKLRAADYRLTYHSKKYDKPLFTFCMCPGGVVVAAASEEGRVVTNGMSEYARDKENANSALVCGVTTEDFKDASPLAGMMFQRRLEETAYRLGGGEYMAPVQRVEDFIKCRVTSRVGSVNPSYTRGYSFADLNECLPGNLCAVMKEALQSFDMKIKGFATGDAILTAVESRTSSPVRIDRKDNCQSVNVSGLFPAGEGAGYAGGIITAAVDGMRVAEEIMKIYAPIYS